jgi:ADP-ribose pyrophosphatase YjhB (NUDIX family)
MLGIPGGHLEEDETARQAAVREIKEELGLKISPDRLVFYATGSVRTTHEYIYQEFFVNLTDSEQPTNAEPEKCSELVWCDPKNLPDDVQDTFKLFINKCYSGGDHYIEIGY